MSWGALPLWFYFIDYEMHEAAILGGFPAEVYSGSTRSLPKENYRHHHATFSSYDEGGWNSDKYQSNNYDSLLYLENFI